MITANNKKVTEIIRYSENNPVRIIKVYKNTELIWPDETQPGPDPTPATIFSNNTDIHTIEDIDNATKYINLDGGHCIASGIYNNTCVYDIASMNINAPINKITMTVSCHSATCDIINIYCSFYDYDTKSRLYYWDIPVNVAVDNNFRWITFDLPETIDLSSVSNPVIAVSFVTANEDKFGRFGALAAFGSNLQMVRSCFVSGLVHPETCPTLTTQHIANNKNNSAYILAYPA